MPLTFSPPPGKPDYYKAGKHNKSVIALLCCLFATLVLFQARGLTGNTGQANFNTTWSIFGPGELRIREAAAGNRIKLESTIDFDMELKAQPVTFWCHEKINLNDLIS